MFRFNFASTTCQQPLTAGAKLNICQQVTNAMTYLHDKNIVHGRLTSVNIYIEFNQRVKISLIDDEEQPIASTTCASRFSNDEKADQQIGLSARFNLPSLTYLSPELLRTLKVEKITDNYNCDTEVSAQVRFDTTQLSKKSDVFSFGTLLYELFEGRFPFGVEDDYQDHTKLLIPPLSYTTETKKISNKDHIDGVTASELIYLIGHGLIGERNLSERGTKLSPVESIISACWAKDPNDRPSFKQLIFA